MGSFLVLIYLGIDPVLSNVSGKVMAGIFAFQMHRTFTFSLEKNQHNDKQKYRYFLLLSANVPVSAVVLVLVMLVVDSLIMAKFLSDVLIVLFSFWISKTWVFPSENNGNMSTFSKRMKP